MNPFNKTYAGPKAFWLGLPKGHDKTTSLGRFMSHALAFSKCRFSAIAGAGDKDQAGFLIEAMQNEAHLNPWYSKHLTFKNYAVEGRHGSKLKIFSSDAGTAQGAAPDIMIVDEVTHWAKKDLFDFFISSKAKKPGAVLLIISNAGVLYSWQHEAMEKAKKWMALDGSWSVYSAPYPLATWMDPKERVRQKDMMTESEYFRLIENVWVDPTVEYDYIPRRILEECATLGRDRSLAYQSTGQPNQTYVASIDYGPKKDRTILVVGHKDADDVIIDKLDIMEGKHSPTGEVRIEAVERWIDDVRRSFNLSLLVVDPYQMLATIQKYEGSLPVERYEARGGVGNYRMAQAMRSTAMNRHLLWYDGCGDVTFQGKRHTLVDEIAELCTKALPTGYRAQHLPGRHDDRFVAIGQMVVHLTQQSLKKNLLWNDTYF